MIKQSGARPCNNNSFRLGCARVRKRICANNWVEARPCKKNSSRQLGCTEGFDQTIGLEQEEFSGSWGCTRGFDQAIGLEHGPCDNPFRPSQSILPRPIILPKPIHFFVGASAREGKKACRWRSQQRLGHSGVVPTHHCQRGSLVGISCKMSTARQDGIRW